MHRIITSTNDVFLRMGNSKTWLNSVAILILLVGFVSAGCATADNSVVRAGTTVSPSDIGAAETWGGASNVVLVKRLYFSEQPDWASFAVAHERDVGVVINLRERGELDWDEQRAATDNGLVYYNVPIARKGSSFSKAAIDEIGSIVRMHDDQKILLHCSSGNRASAWLAIHLVKDHDMGIEDSLSLARSVGLTNSTVENRVLEYLKP